MRERRRHRERPGSCVTLVRGRPEQKPLARLRPLPVRKVNGGGVADTNLLGVQKLFQPPLWITEYETLKVSDKTWEDLDEETASSK